jgi:hypothetical protein
VTAGDDPRGESWRPIPDPTVLTTQQLLRELASLREVYDTRIGAMDRAAEVLAETVNRTPTAIQTAIGNLREVHDERFNSIQQQFRERDVRTEQADKARAEALAAALQAAKEAVFEQAQAAAKAADKTELSFTKLIEQTQLQITTVAEGLGDKIADLKGRIDRGEGSTAGAADTRTDQRLNLGTVIAAVALLLSAVIVFAAFHK